MPHRITVAFQGKMPTMTDVPGPLARKMVFMTMPGDYVTDDFKGSGMAAGVTTHHSAEDPDKDWTYGMCSLSTWFETGSSFAGKTRRAYSLDGQQLFDGTVLGKKGTLVARESMRCVDGKIHNSTWTVVEGSGT